MIYDKSISCFEENGRKITLFSLFVPLLFENIFLQLYGTFNTLLLQRYNEDAVTAVSVSESIVSIAVVLLTMAIKGAVILISFYLGKDKKNKAAVIAGTTAVTVLVISCILSLLMFIFSSRLITFMNLRGTVATDAVRYLKMRAIGLILTAIMTYFNNMLIVNGHAKCTLFTGIISNIFNIILCYLFLFTSVFSIFDGIVSVAVAIIISQFLSVLFLFHFFRKHCPFKFYFKFNDFIKIMVLGIPSCMCNFSYALSQTITTGFIAILGNTMVNAKVYISNIVIYVSRFSMSLGNATGILMGRYRGKGSFDIITKIFRQNIIISVLFNTVISIVVFIFNKPLISMFTDKISIISIVGTIFALDILVEAFRAVNHIGEFSLNANGDVKSTLVISTVSTWVFGVLLSYIFGIVLDMGLVGIWVAFVVDELARTVAYCIRFKSKKWQYTKL